MIGKGQLSGEEPTGRGRRNGEGERVNMTEIHHIYVCKYTSIFTYIYMYVNSIMTSYICM
jgi:hypothetical protein